MQAFENFNSILKESNVKVVHRFPNTIGKMLIKNSPSHVRETGVYRIPCKDCDQSYYGETGRSFNVRLAEHRRDVQNCNISNAAFVHKIENDHRIVGSAKLVFRSDNYFTRRIVESSLIASYPNFNISPGNFKFHRVLQASILKATGLLGIT